MSNHPLVERFYAEIWNAGDERVETLLAPDFEFRGSLGTPARGHEAFLRYVRSVRGSLAGYRCDILECVTEGAQAFARMRFSGQHTAPFRGYAPTGKRVQWDGAALFTFRGDLIAGLWVLGDLVGLEAVLRANAGEKVN